MSNATYTRRTRSLTKKIRELETFITEFESTWTQYCVLRAAAGCLEEKLADEMAFEEHTTSAAEFINEMLAERYLQLEGMETIMADTRHQIWNYEADLRLYGIGKEELGSIDWTSDPRYAMVIGYGHHSFYMNQMEMNTPWLCHWNK